MTEEKKKERLKYICERAEDLPIAKRKLLMIIIDEITDLKPFESGDGTRYNFDILQDNSVIDIVYHLIHNWITEIEEEYNLKMDD